MSGPLLLAGLRKRKEKDESVNESEERERSVAETLTHNGCFSDSFLLQLVIDFDVLRAEELVSRK